MWGWDLFINCSPCSQSDVKHPSSETDQTEWQTVSGQSQFWVMRLEKTRQEKRGGKNLEPIGEECIFFKDNIKKKIMWGSSNFFLQGYVWAHIEFQIYMLNTLNTDPVKNIFF